MIDYFSFGLTPNRYGEDTTIDVEVIGDSAEICIELAPEDTGSEDGGLLAITMTVDELRNFANTILNNLDESADPDDEEIEIVSAGELLMEFETKKPEPPKNNANCEMTLLGDGAMMIGIRLPGCEEIYQIPCYDLEERTPRCAEWIFHLMEKKWFKGRIASDFIEILSAYHRYRLNTEMYELFHDENREKERARKPIDSNEPSA